MVMPRSLADEVQEILADERAEAARRGRSNRQYGRIILTKNPCEKSPTGAHYMLVGNDGHEVCKYCPFERVSDITKTPTNWDRLPKKDADSD